MKYFIIHIYRQDYLRVIVVKIVTIFPDYQHQPAGVPYRLATVLDAAGQTRVARIYANQEYVVLAATSASLISSP